VLVEQLTGFFNLDKYYVVRKQKKSYMNNPISSNGSSIISKNNIYWLDEDDIKSLIGKNLIFCDDVISTCGTIEAVKKILNKYDVKVEAYATVLSEGTDWLSIDGIEVVKLGHFPLPGKESNGETND